MRRLLGALSCLALLTGCATVETSVQDLGGSILKFVGLLPGASTVSSIEGLVQATKDLSREEEYYLGRGVSVRLLAKMTPVQDEALQQYVATVAATVVAAGGVPETFGGYHTLLLESDEVNAFSAPGGYIYLTRGMLESLPDEDSLAAVLAHEIAHIAGHHGVKALNRDKLTDVLTSLGAIAGSMSCNQVLANATILFGATIDDMVSTLLVSGYSRELEFDADGEALHILERAGYDPRALNEVLASLSVREKEHRGSSGGWFKTHPPALDRQAKIQGRLPPETTIPARPTRRSRFEKALG